MKLRVYQDDHTLLEESMTSSMSLGIFWKGEKTGLQGHENKDIKIVSEKTLMALNT